MKTHENIKAPQFRLQKLTTLKTSGLFYLLEPQNLHSTQNFFFIIHFFSKLNEKNCSKFIQSDEKMFLERSQEKFFALPRTH